VGAVHGDLGQGAREQALRAFRSGKIDVLVATDVAARGIDVEGVTHVMNYACPEDEKTYLHRIGRTGRAGASGVAVTLVDWDDVPRWTLINKALGLAFAEPVETYSTSDHVYTGLGIPKTVTGKLPRADRTRAGLAAEEIEDLGETGASAGKRAASGNRSGGRDSGRGKGGSKQSGGRSSGRSGGGKPASDSAGDDSKSEKSGVSRTRNRNRRRTRGGQSGKSQPSANSSE